MSSNTSSGRVGLTSLFLLLFVGLKLAGIITWSWFWVLSPIWIPVIGFFVLILFIASQDK